MKKVELLPKICPFIQNNSIYITCIQDTLSSRAALGLPAFRPSASREQRYLTYKYITKSERLRHIWSGWYTVACMINYIFIPYRRARMVFRPSACASNNILHLYTICPIVKRTWPSGYFRLSARSSKGILQILHAIMICTQ